MQKRKNRSVYIHIPFCDTICTYCDFCKYIKNDLWTYKYLDALKEEIKSKYKGDLIDTIYIGGGTPSSLNLDELKILFDILKIFKLDKDYEFTFECNIENVTIEKLKLLYLSGVNRLSFGVQSFNQKKLKYLNRNHTIENVKKIMNEAKNIGFNNINIDLIYAVKDESLNDLSKDIDLFLSLDINHISTYSLIIEPNTLLYINNEENVDENLDYEMYNLICKKLKENNFIHYEVSNFAKEGYYSRHNLVYWNNLEYYGFGPGASGYIDSIRYDNTRSINNYIKKDYIVSKHKLDIKEKIENEFILGLRKIKGINKKEFKEKYNIDIYNVKNVKKLIEENKLLDDGNNIYINPKYIYISNEILINFID